MSQRVGGYPPPTRAPSGALSFGRLTWDLRDFGIRVGLLGLELGPNLRERQTK